MQYTWKIAACIVAILLIIYLIQYLKRVWISIKRLKVAEKQIKTKMEEIEHMNLKSAEPLGRQILVEKATLESWNEPVPASMNFVLEKLDSSIQSLFRDYRRVFFPETGTEFNSKLLLEKSTVTIEGLYQIGLDKTIQHKLVVKPGSPIILELNENDRVVAEYQSVYHYFLLAEGEF